jgi:inosine-uridine nucleoside N-ribohydrolase
MKLIKSTSSWIMVLTMMWASGNATFATAAEGKATRKIPVILDTDIGDDIDDTWALALVLQSPEFDLKLAVGDYGRPLYRARLLAKLLERAGRADVPVGLGVEVKGVGGEESQAAWLAGYDLGKYPGKIHTNGVQAMIDVIMNSPEPITVLAIGPLPNLEAALAREPRIAKKAVFVGMHGSVRVGYGGGTNIHAEWNVLCAPKAAQAVFAAPWKKTITPLDTCGLVVLQGDRYRQVHGSRHRIAADVIDNYRAWAANRKGIQPGEAEVKSSTLFDCVAVYLAITQDLCVMEDLSLRVTDDGFTRIDPVGDKCRVATKWKDLPAFEQWLVDRLTKAK